MLLYRNWSNDVKCVLQLVYPECKYDLRGLDLCAYMNLTVLHFVLQISFCVCSLCALNMWLYWLSVVAVCGHSETFHAVRFEVFTVVVPRFWMCGMWGCVVGWVIPECQKYYLQNVRSLWPRDTMLLLEGFSPHVPCCTHYICWHLQCCVAMTGAATSSWLDCDVLPSFHLLVDLSADLCTMYILVRLPVGAHHLRTWHG